MQNKELENQMDFLLSAALRKCGDLESARDLAQETMLSAWVYLQKGGSINDLRGWLLTVMNRRYYDMLRKKYTLPTVTIGEGFDLIDETDYFGAIGKSEEAQVIRREIAFLSHIYRTIIARYYFRGESVAQIAQNLGIPAGTVKSRLAFARNEMKKGLEKIDNYTENSYLPQTLRVRNSGSCGLNDEPMSLVPDDDLLTQNLLILAYEKPVAVSELAKAIGIPAAYIESIIEKLVSGELMKRMGDGRLYTDFVIYSLEDQYMYLDDQIKFAADHADAYCDPMRKAVQALKESDFYSPRLARYMVIRIAEKTSYSSLASHIRPQVFPDRPNGGKWIAFGSIVGEGSERPDKMKERENYSLSGERDVHLDEYLGSKDLILYNYETGLYPYPKYDGFGYQNYGEMEADVLRLFYLIHKGIDPESVGFPPKMLKNIPLMAERGALRMENKKLELLISCLTHAQNKRFRQICREAVDEAAAALAGPMGEYIRDKKKKIPPHLKSVPDQKLYLPCQPGPMPLVYGAINQGIIPLDLGYPCPETVAVFD